MRAEVCRLFPRFMYIRCRTKFPILPPPLPAAHRPSVCPVPWGFHKRKRHNRETLPHHPPTSRARCPPSPLPSHRPSRNLGPKVFELLENLRRRAVHVLGDAALQVRGQGGELFAQVPVDDVFHREVAAAERHVVTAKEWRRILPHVHLQMRAEVHVLARHEGHERAHRAHQRGVDDALQPARLQRALGQRADRLSHVELHHLLHFVRCAVEHAGRADVLPPRRILLDLLADVRRKPLHKDVPELVPPRHGVVV
mmetsp:Transcript_24672/g.61482  ORF Transcript_24672/g.61482 Transcript_24672/m.61482 type:complete len:254 (-) Transcript_24672:601-1362(-)